MTLWQLHIEPIQPHGLNKLLLAFQKTSFLKSLSLLTELIPPEGLMLRDAAKYITLHGILTFIMSSDLSFTICKLGNLHLHNITMSTIKCYSNDDLHIYFKKKECRCATGGVWVGGELCLPRPEVCSEAGMLNNWKERSKQTSLLQQ